MKYGVRYLAIVFTAASGLLTLLSSLANYTFFFDTVVHFRLQYALAAGFSLLALGVLRAKVWSLVAAIVLVVNLSFIVPYYLPNDSPQSTTSLASLDVMSINVLSSNTNVEAIRREIEKFKPDILVLQEIVPRWFTALADVSAQYPNQVHAVREDNFGIWLLSKYPVVDQEIIPWGSVELPTATFRYPVGDHLVRIVAMHPMSPADPEGVRWRNEQLRNIAARYKTTDDPLLVIGDLNTTSFSPIFEEFIQRLDLKDSRQGFGLQSTWPAWAFNPLMITLDHCLVSEGVHVIRREVGDYVGSDHLPVYVEVVLSE